jgi:hypothetical protein
MITCYAVVSKDRWPATQIHHPHVGKIIVLLKPCETRIEGVYAEIDTVGIVYAGHVDAAISIDVAMVVIPQEGQATFGDLDNCISVELNSDQYRVLDRNDPTDAALISAFLLTQPGVADWYERNKHVYQVRV